MARFTPFLAAALVLASGCGNQCSFFRRCAGTVLEQCGGVDQMFNRRIQQTPCGAPNGACVQEGEDARCARAPPSPCAPRFSQRCEGSLLLKCLPVAARQYEVAQDCRELGLQCLPAADGPGCR
jgi:hypothetical protein